MSESEYQRRMVDDYNRTKAVERIQAHLNIVRGYADSSLDEQGVAEVLEYLGLSTLTEAASTPGLNAARVLSRAGLTVNAVRGPAPRQPPSRAS